jgi:hypothetical protein
MFSGLVALFVLGWIENLATTHSFIHKPIPSFLCDTGCAPTFVLSIFFGSLAYQLHKRRVLNLKSIRLVQLLIGLIELASFLVFIILSLILSENPTWFVISVFSSLWILLVYGLLVFESSLLSTIQNKKFIFIFSIVASLIVVLGTLWYVDTVRLESADGVQTIPRLPHTNVID